MRIVKEAEIRKNEILDVAERLFSSKGFDHTSTNDILNEIGIARGTLYYHFKSKEDILDGIVERLTNNLISRASKIALDDSLPVLERMTRTILSLHVEDNVGNMIMEEIHRPQNALMHQKLEDMLLSRVNKLVTIIVEDGIKEGIINTPYPAEAVEMIMTYSYIAFDSMHNYTKEEEYRKITGFIFHVERIFNMEEGALKEVMEQIFFK